MNANESALRVLLMHAGISPGSNGLLSSLRPYKKLERNHFFEVMDCLLDVAEKNLFSGKNSRGIFQALWKLSVQLRLNIDETGPLVRNKLITHEDLNFMREWLESYDWCVLHILSNTQRPYQFSAWMEFIAKNPPSEIGDRWLRVIQDSLSFDDSDIREIYAKALGGFVSRKTEALELLRSALLHENTKEVMKCIEQSIEKLKASEGV